MAARTTHQTTIAETTSCTGVGLHSGRPVTVTLRPAAAGAGITFRRTDVTDADPEIALSPQAAVDTRLNTTIGNRDMVTIATVEHLLAAVVGLGLDNVVIDVDGPEIPAMDGSAEPFAQMIADAGLRQLSGARRVLKILKPVEIELDGKRARFEPADHYEIDVSIDFSSKAIGRQRATLTPDPDAFLEGHAGARTFAFLHEVEHMKANGLAQGGSLENCVVVDGDAVMNDGGLRYSDEFARHKALDALGDLALAGVAIEGRYVADRPGHALNNKALRALMAARDAWTVETRQPPRRRPAAGDRVSAAAAGA